MQSEQSEPNAHYVEYYIGFMVSMYAADNANKYQHPGVNFRLILANQQFLSESTEYGPSECSNSFSSSKEKAWRQRPKPKKGQSSWSGLIIYLAHIRNRSDSQQITAMTVSFTRLEQGRGFK